MKFPNPIRFAKSMLRTAILKIAGVRATVPFDVHGARLLFCECCPSNDSGQCQECSCLVIPKTWLIHERCPLGYWDTRLTKSALRSLFKQSWLPPRLQKSAMRIFRALD